MSELAKDYYRNYVTSNSTFGVHDILVKTILDFKPNSVFEFGCGSGKNLKLVQKTSKKQVKIEGIDISPKNIENTLKLNNILDCYVGDENTLACYKEKCFDVTFTCSVLDHIKDVDKIISNLIKMSKKGTVLLETNSVVGDYYYPHNYESYGFTKLDYKYHSTEAVDADGAVYEIWVKKR